MKIIVLLFFIFCCNHSLDAQNESSLLSLIERLESAKNTTAYQTVNTQLEQFLDRNDGYWLAHYYVVLGYAFMSARGFDNNEIQIDKAINHLELLKKINVNDEVLCLESFVYSIKMGKSPYTRWLAYKNRIMHPLEQAQKMNAHNPRIYILLASIHKNIPTWLGGGCATAKADIQVANEKWKTQQMNTVLPHWGGGTLEALKKSCPL